MTSRVYWKGLTLVLKTVQSYIQRNQNNLFLNLDAHQYTCVLAVLNAVIECLQALPVNNPHV